MSDRLVERGPDTIIHVRVPDAGHVESWNVDPDRYEAAVRSFLERIER